jgi:hypothetical protein
MARHESKRLQIRPAKAPNGLERLGSRSEVDRFRVEIRNRLLIVGFAAGESAQLLDQLTVGPSRVTAAGSAAERMGVDRGLSQMGAGPLVARASPR